MTRIWMIALAFFGAMFLAACEPADDVDNQAPAMQEPGDTGGGMGSPTAPE
ncbi:hypothetical protein [Aquibaculum sediminis]|uniref:hypothetical protein n=1 Tax=Aquibaculum sediminis TaxID=3231907 RepID=UPI003456D2F8